MIVEGIIKTFNPELNFWEVHENFLIITEFKKFYNRDRSTNKSRSSREMWGFAFLYDLQKDNFMRMGTEEQRMNDIAKEVIQNENYDWDKEKEVREKMRQLCQPPPQRALYDLKIKMDQRAKFIQDTDYSLDEWTRPDEGGKMILKKGTADQLDKMLLATGKMLEQYDYWMKQIVMERDRRKSPKQQSDTDTGEI